MPRRKPDLDPESGQLVVEGVGPLKAMADPLRLQILVELSSGGDRTVKEVASQLEVPPTRLYYHFKILEQARLIKVASRRLVSGIEERRYRSTASSLTIAPEATPEAVQRGIIAALLSMVRAELELALVTEPTAIGDPDGPVPFLALTRFVMSPREAEMLQRRMGELVERFGQDGPVPEGKREYHAILGAYLRPGELRREEAEAPRTATPKGRRSSRAP
jgi:DNA-binding transcriptional ArsR family regulator